MKGVRGYDGQDDVIRFENHLIDTPMKMWNTLFLVATSSTAQEAIVMDSLRVWKGIPPLGRY